MSVKRNQYRLLGILCGALFSLTLLVVYLVFTGPGRMEVITPDAFEEAQRRWEAADVHSYRLVVEVSGRQPATYEVHVVDSKVQKATRNGQPLTQMRTLDTWTVPGMFYTVSIDVENQTLHESGKAGAMDPNVRVRAVFDEVYGYPQKYHRTQFVEKGENPTTSWTVVTFEVLESE